MGAITNEIMPVASSLAESINIDSLPIGAIDPMKSLTMFTAAMAAGTTAAKAFTIVHQSEMGIKTRRGAPMLRPGISQRVFEEIVREDGQRLSSQDLRLNRLLSQAPEMPLDPVPTQDMRVVDLGAKLEDLPRLSRKERKTIDFRRRVDEKVARFMEMPEYSEFGIYDTRGRGIVWLTPFIDKCVKINVTSQTSSLGEFPFDCLDEQEVKQVKIEPGITWRVRGDGDNVYKALFKVNNDKETDIKNKTAELEQTVIWVVRDGLGRVLRDRNYEEVRNYDRKELTASTQETCQEDLLGFGVELENVWMQPPAVTPMERLSQGLVKALEGKPDPEKSAVAAAIAAGAGGTLISLPGGGNNEAA